MENKKFTAIVTGKFGKYAFKGAGTENEVRSDVTYLTPKYGAENIEVLPVFGAPHQSQKAVVPVPVVTGNMSWKDVVVILAMIYAIYKFIKLFITKKEKKNEK